MGLYHANGRGGFGFELLMTHGSGLQDASAINKVCSHSESRDIVWAERSCQHHSSWRA